MNVATSALGDQPDRLNSDTSGSNEAQYSVPSDSPFKRFNIIITTRGLILLLFISYLFAYPISKKSDIVAAVIAYLALALVISLSLLTLIYGKRIRKKLELKIFPPEAIDLSVTVPSTEVSAKQRILFVMRTNAISVPPGFVLRARLEFESPDQTMALHVISGYTSDVRVLVEETIFPHRGDWRIYRVNFSLQDRFGFSHYEWDITHNELQLSIRINPVAKTSISLPVISSSNRSGDDLPDLKERQGDPFDLKPYHPSDGMKKILWKIYAKSGELISRHPEASMTPEGQVILFSLARKEDEHVCAATLSYIEMLEKLNLSIAFGCEGMGSEESAESYNTAKELLIESVWASNQSNAESVGGEIAHVIEEFSTRQRSAVIQRVIVFCSRARIANQEGYDICLGLAQRLNTLGIKPLFCICSDRPAVAALDIKRSRWERIMYNAPNWKLTPQNENLFFQFADVCRNENWEILEQNIL